MRYTLILLISLVSITLQGQNKAKLYGRVIDVKTGTPLIGATIFVLNSTKGTISNEYGFFNINIIPGSYNLRISYIGYKTDTIALDIISDKELTISLELLNFSTQEIVISTQSPDKNIKSVETGTVRLTMQEIKKLPALMGESDFIRIIQMTPGISAANDGNASFYVRGGGADQNLILFDNAVIYNPSHILGFFSVFNAKTIANTKLIKSGMPANYGGRLSSIINITSRDGDLNKHHINGNIGLLSSGISIEGPILKNKISFLLAARRSYIDEIIKPIAKPIINGSSTFYNNSLYYFYDLNGKLTFKPNSKNKISITLYGGVDFFILEEPQLDFKNNMKWGNKIAAANWFHHFNSNWNLANSLSFTSYRFNLGAYQNNISLNLFSGVRDITLKSTLSNVQENGSIIKIGMEYISHNLKPNNLSAQSFDTDLQFGSNREMNAHEASVFYNHEFNIFYKLRINAGIRYTHYVHVGPYFKMNKNEINEIVDTTYYGFNESIKTYNALEPRISARYQLNRFASIKASFSINNQFMHLASSSTVTLPTDIWLPSTSTIKPQIGKQFTIGYFRNFKEHKYISSITAYYKSFNNQIELVHGFINNFHDNIFEESIAFGTGNSYGIEIYLQKTMGAFSGWIGYTLSKTNRKFDAINEGKVYPAKYDRRHDINIIAAYDLNKKWSFSASFIYATGNALTLPETKYVIDGNVITQNSSINSFRMPDYHRLDISLNYLMKKNEKFESSLNFSVFNVYNRANPFYIYFEIAGNVYDGNIKITPKQVSLFPILPSISWNFRF